MTQQNHSNQKLLFPLPGRAAIYTRVAAKHQTTQRQQSDDLLALALAYGYTGEQVATYEDVHVSSRTAPERRPALTKLFQDLYELPPGTEPIQAIFIAAEDRLFRDADMIEVVTFIETCIKYCVLLVTPTSVYDFTNPSHVALFRFKCEMAGQYLQQMITNRLQTGKRHKREQRENNHIRVV